MTRWCKEFDDLHNLIETGPGPSPLDMMMGVLRRGHHYLFVCGMVWAVVVVVVVYKTILNPEDPTHSPSKPIPPVKSVKINSY